MVSINSKKVLVSLLTLFITFISLNSNISTFAQTIPTLHLVNTTSPQVPIALCDGSTVIADSSKPDVQYRKGWDGTIKGRIYYDYKDGDCHDTSKLYKSIAIKTESNIIHKDLAYRVSGQAAFTGVSNAYKPILNSSELSPSITQTNSLLHIDFSNDTSNFLSKNIVCLDNQTRSVDRNNNVTIGESGLHTVKFVTASAYASISSAQTSNNLLDCSKLPISVEESLIQIPSNKTTTVSVQITQDYTQASMTGVSTEIAQESSSRCDMLCGSTNHFKLLDADLDGDGTIEFNMKAVGTFSDSSSADDEYHFVISFDRDSTLPDDEITIDFLSADQLYGGATETSGIVSPRDPSSGLPTGKRVHKPFHITAGNKTGHVTLIKQRTEVSSIVPRSSVTSPSTVKGYISNSPFVAIPTSYTINSQGNYVFTTAVNGPIGQYILLDTGVTNSSLIRTGGITPSTTMNHPRKMYALAEIGALFTVFALFIAIFRKKKV